MSRYDLVINGVPISVEVLSVSGGQATVCVNGVTFQVEHPGGASAAPRPARTPTAQRGPGPARRPAAETRSPGAEAPRPPAAEPPRHVAPPAGGEAILAPMPGQVVRLMVGLGERVTAGAPVVLMEAMKMENEIRSHIDGRVAAIRVIEGQAVKVNEVLVLVSPG